MSNSPEASRLPLFLARDLDTVEKKRIGVVAVLFVAAAMFFAGLEQAGSSLNLFAERHTDRTVAGWEMPAGWFQMINPLFVVILAPLAANVWVMLSKRDRDPSLGMKFSLGLCCWPRALPSSRWARSERWRDGSGPPGCCSRTCSTRWASCALVQWA